MNPLPLAIHGRSPGGLDYWLSAKILVQMAKRGWSQDDIEQTLDDPAQVVPVHDARWHAGGSRGRSDPATVYARRNAGNQYRVRNDIAGEIVQSSDRNDPAWMTPW